ncbi:MAG: hypothetical protein KGM49_00730 [Sphingomonadales bacterium]|nr:hypothetical protein [Sphingomonadales bacterium]
MTDQTKPAFDAMKVWAEAISYYQAGGFPGHTATVIQKAVDEHVAGIIAERDEAVDLLERTVGMPIPYPTWRANVTEFLQRIENRGVRHD